MIDGSTAKGSQPPKRRKPKDPTPRFKEDRTRQLDAISGCPEAQVPQDHLARKVLAIVSRLDVSDVEAKYSALGRRGYHPHRLLGVLVYASLTGVHHVTKIARACETDAAYRLLAGGYAVSRSTLQRFRQGQAELFRRAIDETVAMAHEEGLIDPEALAVDSLRLRAHASTKAVQSLRRSKKRLAELEAEDVTGMTQEALAAHQAKVEKHRAAVHACQEAGRPSLLTTNPMAALMKFPSGAGLPGHRVTVSAVGVKERFVLGVLVDAATNDYGKLERAVIEAREVLERAGVPNVHLGVAADAGYNSEADLGFALENREWVDVLVASETAPKTDKPRKPKKYYERDRFVLDIDALTVRCPADKPMRGPYNDSNGRTKWVGVGCKDCPLRPKCTPGRERALTVSLRYERSRRAMQDRLAEDGGRARYNQRIATVEPVFASVEDSMGYRRVSSRHPETVVAEVLLKMLAHNVSRLVAAQSRTLACVLVGLLEDGTWAVMGAYPSQG